MTRPGPETPRAVWLGRGMVAAGGTKIAATAALGLRFDPAQLVVAAGAALWR